MSTDAQDLANQMAQVISAGRRLFREELSGSTAEQFKPKKLMKPFA